jgi:hypothetical protein
MQPRAGQCELAEQGAEGERRVVLDAPRPPTGRARHAAAEESGDLPLEHVALQRAEDLLSLAEHQAQLLDAFMALG